MNFLSLWTVLNVKGGLMHKTVATMYVTGEFRWCPLQTCDVFDQIRVYF